MLQHAASNSPLKKSELPEKSVEKVTTINLNIEGGKINFNLRLELDGTKTSNISLDSSNLEDSVNKGAVLEKSVCVEKSINTVIAPTACKRLQEISSRQSTVETSPKLSATESSPIQRVLGKLYIHNLKTKLAQAMHKTEEKQVDNSVEICQNGKVNGSSENVSNGHLMTTMGENTNIKSEKDERLDENSSGNVNNGHSKTIMKENSDIDSKIDQLLDENSSSESENEQNPFVETMAEEGEEDTPSEGSNDIIEVGEEINTTESEFSEDSYENDSFIDDEEKHELLSGDEYDLSWDNNKKRTRIIKLSSGSDDDIVRIERPKKVVKKRKKSRIIRFKDSSDEENINVEQESNKKIVILENIRIQDIDDKYLSDNINNAINTFCPKMKSVVAGNPIVKTDLEVEETVNKFSSNNIDDVVNVSSPTLKNNDDSITSTPVTENNVLVLQNIGNKDISDNTCPEMKNKVKFTTSTPVVKKSVQAHNIDNKETSDNICTKTKNNFNLSTPSPVTENNGQVEDIISKQSSETTETNKVKKNKKKKRKNKMKPKINGEIVSEEKICRKNKKRKRSKKVSFDESAAKKSKIVNILDEVVMNKKEIGCSFESTLLNKDWSVNSIVMKPSQEGTNLKNKKIKNLKPDTEKTKDFKDFKSQMLYDRARNLRIETHKLLRKKLA